MLPRNLCLIFLLNFCGHGTSQKRQAIIYEHSEYQGDSITVDLPVRGCLNILGFNDRASSVKTDDCIRLWENIDCTGARLDIAPPGAAGLNNFNDMATAVSDCCSGNGDSSGKVIINMDTSRAPRLVQFGNEVKKIMEDWFPFVENLMRTSAYKTVREINVYFDPDYDGVAYASGNRIVGATRYFENHLDDYGAFIHEMTHVVHQARGCPGWLVEAYAEWTRRWFYEPWTAREKPGPGQSYRDGYTTAAWLLAYVTSFKTKQPMAYLLNKACQEGTWRDSIWEELTTRTVDQLWDQMINDKEYPWK